MPLTNAKKAADLVSLAVDALSTLSVFTPTSTDDKIAAVAKAVVSAFQRGSDGKTSIEAAANEMHAILAEHDTRHRSDLHSKFDPETSNDG